MFNFVSENLSHKASDFNQFNLTKNMQNKYKIIAGLIAILLIAAAIFAYIEFFKQEKIIKNHPNIEFLNIVDSETDSVLNALSIDDLLNKLLIDRNDSSLIMQFGNEQKYLDAISDSNTVIKILHNKSKDVKKFYIFNLNKHELSNFNDSTYIDFIINKYANYKKIVNRNALCGFQLDSNRLYELKKHSLDTNGFAPNLYEYLTHKTDFLCINNGGNIAEKLKSDGLLIAQLSNQLFTDNQLLNALKSNINLFCTDKKFIPQIKLKIRKLIADKKYSETEVRQKLRKLIKAEIWLQKTAKNTKITDSLSNKLLSEYLVEKSICLLNNQDTILPFSNNIYDKKLLVVYLGKKINRTFKQNIQHYIDANFMAVNSAVRAKSLRKYKRYNKILLIDKALNDSILYSIFNNIMKYGMQKNSVVINISNLENLQHIADSFPCLQTIGNSQYDYKLAAQAVFGGFEISGHLPYSIDERYKFGSGYQSPKIRLKYAMPEDAKFDAKKLQKIDKIAREGIRRGAFPACQIFVARQGKVVYHKSFGYHTYAEKQRLQNSDIFDLASVTKIAATTIACMKMNSDKALILSDKLSKFFKDKSIDYTRIKADTLINIDTFEIKSITNWAEFLAQNDTINIGDSLFIVADTSISKLTPKRNIFQISLERLLKHKSGIAPAVPVFRYIYYKTYFLKYFEKQDSFKNILNKVYYKKYDISSKFPDNTNLPDSIKTRIIQGFDTIYDKYFTENYIKDTSEIQITDNQYFKQQYFDTIWRDIKQIPVYSNRISQYSDVNMVLLQMAMDSVNGMNIDKFLKREIYSRLGLKNITFLPLENYPHNKIVPTEMAENWRYGLLKGFVHDPSAALLGSIAGNAGLFANAHDLGVLFQMVLNKGSYGRQEFIKPEVVEKFTKRQEDTQRALGFDMPNREAIIGSKASKNSFGHSGYTGTCVWLDPDNQLVYVFLSNRNHPSSKNWKIIKYKIRQRIHNAIYDAMISSQKK